MSELRQRIARIVGGELSGLAQDWSGTIAASILAELTPDIDTVAAALWRAETGESWVGVYPPDQEHYRMLAQAALSAAGLMPPGRGGL